MYKDHESCIYEFGQTSSIKLAYGVELGQVSILIIYEEAQPRFHSCVIDLKMLFGLRDSPNGIRIIKLRKFNWKLSLFWF